MHSTTSSLPTSVRIVEVGPRDGLQNEKVLVPTSVKVEFISRLAGAGLTHVEATSFVSPKWVPQVADHKEVMTSITTLLYPYVSYPVLVFNLKGLDAAVECGVEEVALYVLPGSHSEKRISSTAWMRDWPMLNFPTVAGINVRGYRSCVMGCRYKDSTDPNKVVMVAKIMLGMGSHEMSLGDTIGVGHTWPLALSERCWRMWRRWCRCSR